MVMMMMMTMGRKDRMKILGGQNNTSLAAIKAELTNMMVQSHALQ
jgi:DnaJ-domain-containing protein 1